MDQAVGFRRGTLIRSSHHTQARATSLTSSHSNSSRSGRPTIAWLVDIIPSSRRVLSHPLRTMQKITISRARLNCLKIWGEMWPRRQATVTRVMLSSILQMRRCWTQIQRMTWWKEAQWGMKIQVQKLWDRAVRIMRHTMAHPTWS